MVILGEGWHGNSRKSQQAGGDDPGCHDILYDAIGANCTTPIGIGRGCPHQPPFCGGGVI
jgi:hypothetical protein